MGGEAVLTGLRAHVDDLAGALGHHDAHNGLVHEEGGLGVDVQLTVILFLGDGEDRAVLEAIREGE